MSLPIGELIVAGQEALAGGFPKAAVMIARELSDRSAPSLTRDLNVASLLIDAGSDLRDMKFVREGIALLERWVAGTPTEYDRQLRYNLGTGYLTLGQRERGRGPGTRPALTRAVSNLSSAVELGGGPETIINLCNALTTQGRAIETLDIINEVVREHPAHPVAYVTRAEAQLSVNGWLLPHRGLVESAAADYAKAISLSGDDPLFRAQIENALTGLNVAEMVTPKPISPDPVEEWLQRSGLGLNPCRFCLIESPSAFDTYVLPGRLRMPGRRPSAAEVAELVNAIHQNYATARLQLLLAAGVIPDLPSDHVIMGEGIAGAVHSLRVGFLMAAITGFYALLDKVAYALNAYLHLGVRSNEVAFNRVWARPGWKPPKGGPLEDSDRARRFASSRAT